MEAPHVIHLGSYTHDSPLDGSRLVGVVVVYTASRGMGHHPCKLVLSSQSHSYVDVDFHCMETRRDLGTACVCSTHRCIGFRISPI